MAASRQLALSLGELVLNSPEVRRVRAVIDKMKEVMECSICYNLPRSPPVHQCDRGHCICSTCREKVTTCPICRRPLGQSRNLVVEKLLAELSHLCKFSDHGCTFEQTIPELERHEEDCLHRPVNCVMLSCDEKVPLFEMADHINEKHNDATDVSHAGHFGNKDCEFTGAFNPHEESSDEILVRPTRIYFHGQQFFLERWRNPLREWVIWVYMIGQKETCKEYTYTLKIFSAKEAVSKPSECVPLHYAKERVPSFVLSKEFAKRFSDNEMIRYRLKIEPRKLGEVLEGRTRRTYDAICTLSY